MELADTHRFQSGIWIEQLLSCLDEKCSSFFFEGAAYQWRCKWMRNDTACNQTVTCYNTYSRPPQQVFRCRLHVELQHSQIMITKQGCSCDGARSAAAWHYVIRPITSVLHRQKTVMHSTRVLPVQHCTSQVCHITSSSHTR